jgi:polyisoprenoid-binding protein YceI
LGRNSTPSFGAFIVAIGLVATLAMSSLATAATRPAQLLRSDSSLEFTAFTSVFDAEGTFDEWSVNGVVKPDAFAESSVVVTIRAASIDTDNSKRDEHLRSDDFFDVARYPELKFATTSITPKRPGVYDVTGKFTIKDVTREITLPVAVERKGDRLRVRGTLKIDRYDYGLDYEASWYAPDLKREVNIRFDLVFET